MADDRGEVLKSLGVKRRGGGGGEEESDAKQAEPKKKASGSGLGIKRRSGPAAEGAEGAAKKDGQKKEKKGGGSGLGIKRRTGPEAEQDDADKKDGDGGAKREAGKKEKTDAEKGIRTFEPKDSVGPAKGKLGDDQTAVMLVNFFKCRPDLSGKLPERIWELHRTHGRYLGDGREERKLVVGWEPAYVLYFIPTYPDGPPKFTKDWKMIEPGPNRQPKFVEDGFVVDEPYNLVGEWYYYIIFKSDGKPVEPEPQEEPVGKKEASRKQTSPPLGIRRRK